jgi:hypothetical protein
MLRAAVLVLLASGLSLNLRADMIPITTSNTYSYTFTLPTFDSDGNPNGGSFTTVISFSPVPLENTVLPEEEFGSAYVGPMIGYVDVTQSPEPGVTFGGSDYENIDPEHQNDLVGSEYSFEYSGAELELYWEGNGAFVGFAFAGTDSFWSGSGGTFGSDPTGSSFAVYLTSGDPPCTNCSVNITPEPGSIALLGTVAAAMSLIGFRRRNRARLRSSRPS